MRKSPESSHRIHPLQRLSQRPNVIQILAFTAVGTLIVSAIFIFVIHTQENEYGFPVATDMEDLLEMSSLEDKYCLVKFEAPYCFPCTHENPIDEKAYFQSVADQYVMYQMNALDLDGEGPDLTRHYEVKVLPTWLVLDSQGEEVYRWESRSVPPVETLERLEALREIPASTDYARESKGEQDFGTDQMLTLSWQTNLSYWDAIRVAEQLEPMVLESVWTQPNSSGSWTVCSGTYKGITEARKSRLFHTEWRENPLEIVVLKESGWTLPEH